MVSVCLPSSGFVLTRLSGGVTYALPDHGSTQKMKIYLYHLLYTFLEVRLPANSIRSYLSTTGSGITIPAEATFFKYVVIGQHRYWASEYSTNAANSFVAVRDGFQTYKVGQLTTIFSAKVGLPQRPHIRLGAVKMLKLVEDAFPCESAWATT
jgi:hypothetical protein